ncbi:MAG: hypothetical protein HY360_05600, partial [Verrucomicrobia bacterium]|nr:hypothetical protein [Verrucomicrobiota bacterium]
TGEGSGALFDFLAQHNPSSGIYPGWTSMGWYTLFSPRGGGAFTLQTRNKDACHIWMTQKKDPSAVAMEYKFSRMLVVEPDAAGEAEYEIGWHDGDWHQSAELYRTWMNSWMQKLPTPNWVRHADGWFDAGQGIAARYMTHGWPKMEWFGASFSGNFGRAMDGTISCTDFPFVNPRLGTAAEFRKAHAAAREKGWHSVYYWNWMAWNDAFADASHIGPTPRALLPPDIRLRPRGFVEEYGTRDSSGKLEPCIGLGMSAFEFAGDYVMCSGSTGWKDMLVDGMAHNYGAALGADGVYLDQSGLAAQFCASTGHGHGSQQAVAGVGMSEVFKRSVEQGRLKNPDFALAIEGNCDRYMQSASFGLWLSSPYWDGNVFQYVFPDAKLLRGHHNGGGLSVTIGEYARYLNLFLTGDLAGNFHELKEFYAHRKRIGDWMHNGVFQDDVGLSVSKPGIEAKWFKRNEKEHLGACVNIHNEESISGAMLRLRWSKLKGTPVAFAYLWGGELKTTPVQWEDDAAVIAVPTAQASTLLVIAEAPRNESIRAHGYWPLASGPDKLILVLANISGRSRTATLSYQSPDSVTLRDPPRALKVPAREVVRQEIPMSGIARMLSRGNLEVRIQEGGWFRKTTKQIACSLAPPLVNGSFETDSAGNGTPDLWAAWGVEILTQLLQLKEFPPIVQNDKGVIHHADGFMDPTNAAEGKYGLLLPGRLMLPYTWCRKPSDPSPIPNQPFFFKTGQQLILKPATRYRLGFQHKQEAEDGMLEMTAEVCEWPYRPPPAFPPQKIPAAKENRRWTPFSYEFETNKDLEGTPDLQIANKSAGKAWIDAVEIRELGGAETN